MKSICKIAALSAVLLMASAPVTTAGTYAVNDLVPIAVYTNTNASFGLAYDSGSGADGIIWSNPVFGGNPPLAGYKAFSSFTAAEIAALPTIGGVYQIDTAALAFVDKGMTPMGAIPGESGIEALGYNTATGQLVINNSVTGRLMEFTPFTGAVTDPDVGAGSGVGNFLDGLDVDSGDSYTSREFSEGVSRKNGAVFLDSTNPAQGLVEAPAPIGVIFRWAGIERAGDFVYAVADTSFGRTIAVYDLAGNPVAIDVTGNPFAVRIEDLAFDGRYLYGTDFALNQIYVFDIVGPGGLAVPEPSSMVLLGVGAFSMMGYAWRRRKLARQASPA